MPIKFTKINGAGNDFIVINNIEEKLPIDKISTVAKTLCHRHLSIGADGLILIEKSDQNCDCQMIFYNSDGSIGEMCGNGARSLCRYCYENKISGENQVIQTTAGIVTGKRIDKRNYKIQLNNPTTIKLNQDIIIDDKTYKISYIELGNPGLPHVTVEIPDLDTYNKNSLRELGRKIRNYKDFPKGANVNFYQIKNNTINELTYERGVEDFTYACGTGTGSLGLVLYLTDKVNGDNINVNMPGGTLTIDIVPEHETYKIFLTGPTNYVAEGIVLDEELNI